MTEATRDCPKCTGTLERVEHGDDIVVHRCTDCRGLWCPADMLVRMKQAWMADAVLDVGHPKIGEKLDKVEKIDCPDGHGPMMSVRDRNQKHIRYEVCPVCDGVYLDAGEFTDLKHFTPADWIKDLIAHFQRD